MSVESQVPSSAEAGENTPPLCREAILPREQQRGMGGIAIVCTMAGVASGLALATTLMAVQIVDGRQVSTCLRAELRCEPRGLLGVEFHPVRGSARVRSVQADTPAERLGLRPGDVVRAIDGERIRDYGEVVELIRAAGPGAQPSIVIRRGEIDYAVQPTLATAPRPAGCR